MQANRRLDRLVQHVDNQRPVASSRLSQSATIARSDYTKMYEQSLNDRDAFWSAAAKDIDWVEPFKRVLDDDKKPFYRWFTGGKLSVCFNAIDRHLATRGDQTAIFYDSPVTKSVTSISFKQLHDVVSRAAGMLTKIGVRIGDRIIVYMPMIPEALYSMLACARVGAIHSVVFGGFASPELAARIDDAEPVAMLCASCGVEPTKIVEYMPLLNKAIDLAKSKPRHVVVKQREQCKASLIPGRDLDWDEAVAGAPSVECVAVDSTHPLYILYTSGTTGKPKGVLRDSASYAVALKWSMDNFMRTKPGETYWAASDVGWVVGHSYICYAPLLNGSSTVLFEGKPVGTPDAGTFWRIISQHRVTGFFVAPTALRAIRKEDPKLELMKRYDISCLKAFFVAGERCDPATAVAFSAALGMDVIDNWWQTETGWPICGFQDDAIGMRPGSTSLPFPGYDLQVLNDAGEPLPRGSQGTLAVKLPLPPSCFPTLWNNDQGYIDGYMTMFPGYYATGDAGVIDSDGYVTVLERTDDVINVAAHRLSTGSIEAVVKAQIGVSDAAVVGTIDEQKGQVPIALVVLNSEGIAKEAAVMQSIREAVRSEIGAIATLAGVAKVEQLPKTRSGKVLRKNIRGLADGKPIPVPGTIDNIEAMDLCVSALASLGYPKAT
jgi:propionyl-CoA synthetase